MPVQGVTLKQLATLQKQHYTNILYETNTHNTK